MYSKFTIENFRCFEDQQSLLFAIPLDGKMGSGITYIVGENNSGKTTLIEGIWMKKDKKIKSSERLSGKDPVFSLFDSDGGLVRCVKLLREESFTLIEDPEIKDNKYLFEIISSRRNWNSNVSNRGIESIYFIDQSTDGDTARKEQGNVDVSSILRSIESNNDKYINFTKLVQRIIPDFNKWAVGYEDNEYIEYISKKGIKHKTDFLGDGVISIIRILAHLFEDSNRALIIDEPELSLHPLAQKKLIKIIAEYSEKRQIIICTHSPYFISWEYIKNGAKLNRTLKEDDTTSKIYHLEEFKEYEGLVKGGNWKQPYLMDIVSKEIFFQENILFLEGQEDVGLLKYYFQDLDINLFGYGVRGYDNFKLAFKLAKDLGIKKACAFIDSPLDSSKANNENNAKISLETDFPDYKIIQWNKSDIRDKKEEVIKAKNGYFNENGKIKMKDELDDFSNKITMAKEYFNKATVR